MFNIFKKKKSIDKEIEQYINEEVILEDANILRSKYKEEKKIKDDKKQKQLGIIRQAAIDQIRQDITMYKTEALKNYKKAIKTALEEQKRNLVILMQYEKWNNDDNISDTDRVKYNNVVLETENEIILELISKNYTVEKICVPSDMIIINSKLNKNELEAFSRKHFEINNKYRPNSILHEKEFDVYETPMIIINSTYFGINNYLSLKFYTSIFKTDARALYISWDIKDE